MGLRLLPHRAVVRLSVIIYVKLWGLRDPWCGAWWVTAVLAQGDTICSLLQAANELRPLCVLAYMLQMITYLEEKSRDCLS